MVGSNPKEAVLSQRLPSVCIMFRSIHIHWFFNFVFKANKYTCKGENSIKNISFSLVDRSLLQLERICFAWVRNQYYTHYAESRKVCICKQYKPRPHFYRGHVDRVYAACQSGNLSQNYLDQRHIDKTVAWDYSLAKFCGCLFSPFNALSVESNLLWETVEKLQLVIIFVTSNNCHKLGLLFACKI